MEPGAEVVDVGLRMESRDGGQKVLVVVVEAMPFTEAKTYITVVGIWAEA